MKFEILRVIAAAACISAFGIGVSRACVAPNPGTGMTADQLIDNARDIYLVRVDYIESRGGESTCSSITGDGVQKEPTPCVLPTNEIYHLKITEIIKGSESELAPVQPQSQMHYGADFDGHRDKKFWNEDIGRAEWPCCICTPDHTFKEGETYLYFPELLGARKSAELIRSADDKWLQYVRVRVAANDNREKGQSQ